MSEIPIKCPVPTGVSENPCPDVRRLYPNQMENIEPEPEILEADEIIKPGQKSKKESARETLDMMSKIIRIWMP